MGFWKNDVPDIISLKKDEQGFITIEHSQGVFKMHENDVRDISFINDRHSEFISSISRKALIFTLAFLILGGLHNILCQYYIKNAFDNDSGLIIGGISIVLEFLTLIFLLNRISSLFNGFFKQKKDVIIIRNNSTLFKFRYTNSDKIEDVFSRNMEGSELNSIRLNWIWIGLLALWIFCSLYFWTKIPFWFGASRDPVYLTKEYTWLGFQGSVDYFRYRNSEIGLIKLFRDGIISNFCLTSVVLLVSLILIYIFLVFYIPIFFCHWILNSLIPWNEKKIKFLDLGGSRVLGMYSLLSGVIILLTGELIEMSGIHGPILTNNWYQKLNNLIPESLSFSLFWFIFFFPFYSCVYIASFMINKCKSKS
jgi:hypothetical protein